MKVFCDWVAPRMSLRLRAETCELSLSERSIQPGRCKLFNEPRLGCMHGLLLYACF